MSQAMANDLMDCRRRLDSAQNRLSGLDAYLYARDFDQATAIVREAWRDQLIPVEYLTTRWDGEFWANWDRREVVVRNILDARDEMVGAEPERLPLVLRRTADLILANLHQLRGALALAHADVGPDRV